MEFTCFLYTQELAHIDDVTPSRRPANASDYAIAVPIKAAIPSSSNDRIAAIIHVFYPDLLPDILAYLSHVPCGVDLFISTDTEEKADAVRRHCTQFSKGLLQVRIFPNRGRDIAPMIVGFRDILEQYKIFIHLHTKRSPHGGNPLAGWRTYLLRTLLGSESTIQSIFYLMEETNSGIVFPQHLYALRGILNWGYDLECAAFFEGQDFD